ncbi:Rhodanese domain protein [Methanothrix thermoacetophila PT]|uniref:Rhodanese domain protein n=1 Tax=Methanothrix thermoacetophila (strain DSM 6194 / JCM 14653 / NBRC 101360 / PT) TaxID=349307 RepID=A0B831_METTP|nr:Rhodanese domain protein [Methanothrix thermoacetophila PT]
MLLDVSEEAESHIPGAVHINYTDLCGEDEILKPPEDLARIFGKAGISDSDSVVIYGECRPCGGSGVTIHPSTLTYFALLYLGHRNVWLLDRGITGWTNAGMPTASETSKRPPAVYTPHPRGGLLASIDYIKNSDVQLVDARTVQEFEASTILGSINIPADTVVSGGWFREDSELENLFRAKGLTKEKPVVVFTSTGVKATVVWFALKRMGYDARLFAMRRWVGAGETIVKP